MSYPKARLLLGVSGVGTFVVLATLALALGLPVAWSRDLGDFEVISTAIALYVIVSAPFDWLGGYFLPRAYGLRCDTAGDFAGRWARAVSVQAGVMGVCLAGVLSAGRAGGLPGAGAAFGLCMVALVVLQAPLARVVAGLRDEGGEPVSGRGGVSVRRYMSADPGFTGGVVGPPGGESIVIPAHWRQRLSPWNLQAILTRRRHAVTKRARAFGIGAAVLWNLGGFVCTALLVPGADVTTAGGLLTLALGLGLWTFVGLLALPTPSRRAVYAIDQSTANENRLGRQTLATAIRQVHDLQHDELRRGAWIETVFHPIPALDHRLDNLASVDTKTVMWPWHLARTSLFLSWACFGFLSRAVHCNVGLPDMWVLLPSD